MNKDRLTPCQQPRSYGGSKRYPELLGVKSCVGGIVSLVVKAVAQPYTHYSKLQTRDERGAWNFQCRVKSVDIGRNTDGVGRCWLILDTKARKRGEQTGLDTLVVHAVNYGC